MSDTTVRVSAPIHSLLRQLAEAEGSSLQGVLARALEAYRRQRFLEQLNADYAALHADPAASAAYQAETAEWDATLSDGLPVEPPPSRQEEGRRGRNRVKTR